MALLSPATERTTMKPISTWGATLARLQLSAASMLICGLALGLNGTSAAQPAVEETLERPAAEVAPQEAPQASALTREIALDQERRQQLQSDLKRQQDEYDAANQELTRLQGNVAALQQGLTGLLPGSDAAAKASADLAEKERQLALAQRRFDLALAERNATQSLLEALDEKSQQDDKALQRAQGLDKSLAPSPSGGPAAQSPPFPSATLSPEALLTPSPSAPSASSNKQPISQRVAGAQSEAAKRERAAEKARQSVDDLQQRQQLLADTIDLERKRLATARERHDHLSESLRTQEEALYGELSAGREYASLGELTQRLEQTREQLRAVSQTIQEGSQRVETLRLQLEGLQREEVELAREAQVKSAEARQAQWRELLVTAREYVILVFPKVILIGLGVLALHWLIHRICLRLITVWASRGRGSQEERERHARTLMGVFENAATIALYVAGTLAILDTLQVPIGTLLGGVAVVGLAVAFGAQNLIRDYFYGFMILLENQYKIGDVITVNGNTGTVERITLRITMLRDFEGKVYFIPHGEIKSVINLTHEWSRVVLDVGVAYKEKTEKVFSVLLELAEEIYHEPAFQGSILQEPELLGVEQLADSAVVVRLCLMTRPDKKWPVRREMLRRIKNRFDELGIEIPFPQRTLHWQAESSAGVGEAPAALAVGVQANGAPEAAQDAG
jgi:small conductance mechanosensitive channel